MNKVKLFALMGAVVLSQFGAAGAAVVSGFNSTELARNDDSYFGPFDLGFSANYFGNSYAQTFVSNNGYVTFGAGSGAYTPIGLGAGYSGSPIIAAFYADVDTRAAGSAPTTYGTGTFGGNAAFGVTWNGVGYYGVHDDKLNTFQLLLVNRADTGTGNFDIVFNYDQVQWETGDANSGRDGLGGNSASVGYNAGSGNADGTYYQFTGSQVNGAFLDGGPNSLAANSNVGVAGRYVFNVRNGTVTPPPTSDVPEPATWATMVGGFGVIGSTLRRRRRVAVSFG